MKLLSYRPMYYNEIDHVTSNCYVATCINDDDCKFRGCLITCCTHASYTLVNASVATMYITLYIVMVSREKLFIISAVV